jgi:hypothetical protein
MNARGRLRILAESTDDKLKHIGAGKVSQRLLVMPLAKPVDEPSRTGNPVLPRARCQASNITHVAVIPLKYCSKGVRRWRRQRDDMPMITQVFEKVSYCFRAVFEKSIGDQRILQKPGGGNLINIVDRQPDQSHVTIELTNN